MSDPFSDQSDEWDPLPHERIYYTHVLSGDLGWLVRREGKDVIKLDRPGLDEVRPFSASDWNLRHEVRPMAPGQVAKVMFEAHKALMLALAIHDKSKVEWADLSPEKRRAWIERGPTKPPIAAALYAAIKRTLAPLTSP